MIPTRMGERIKTLQIKKASGGGGAPVVGSQRGGEGGAATPASLQLRRRSKVSG